MSVSFASALRAATDVAASQHYPQGTLYVVATPIGNLADITLRALHVLQFADTIACEDTRHTQGLLRSYGIEKTGGQLLAVHQHNEEAGAQAVVDRLRQGQRVAYVSDAGTPAVSDPGARLVAAVQAASLAVAAVPGASSITAALSVAGAVTRSDAPPGFVFAGFLPTKSGERAAAVEALRDEARCVVLLEAPHRIADLAAALSVLGEREVTFAREISKQFESISRARADGLCQWLAADPNRSRGEFVVVLHPSSTQGENRLPRELLSRLLPLLPLKTAVQIAAEVTGGARNALYEQALQLREQGAAADDGASA